MLSEPEHGSQQRVCDGGRGTHLGSQHFSDVDSVVGLGAHDPLPSGLVPPLSLLNERSSDEQHVVCATDIYRLSYEVSSGVLYIAQL